MEHTYTNSNNIRLPYDPSQLPRELNRHYIAAGDLDIAEMLKTVGVSEMADLYAHIPEHSRFASAPGLPEELDYLELAQRLQSIAGNNRVLPSFIGDGLPDFSVHPIVPYVASLRNLTTAYTPYQPERSQGTLLSHWIYQCAMSRLTGFEAINSSLYDRSTAIFEAICTAVRLSKDTATTALIPEALYPGDMEVVKTLIADTGYSVETLPLDAATGTIDLAALRRRATELGPLLAAIVFPQVNCLGLLEDVDSLADLAAELKVKSIAVIDPILLATEGLKRPVKYGAKGVDMIVGEAQHLAIGPNFGGPGLGLFGVRLNDQVRNDVRQTPGRYVGKAKDSEGRDCLVMVMSTREQHIRKDKATSNICSNQAFLATLAGAALLGRGDKGLQDAVAKSRQQAVAAATALLQIPGVALAWPETPFFNEFTLAIPEPVAPLILQASRQGLHLGVDVSDRVGGGRNLLKLSFSDKDVPIELLLRFLRGRHYQGVVSTVAIPAIPVPLRRAQPAGLPNPSVEELHAYYAKLNDLNLSPDDACYPLGSCTMKYNPFINDWAANLQGFTDIHPQAPSVDAQGSLEVLYEIQQWFKAITGLPGVTTQPVAGAQGELVGLKLFQAYHRHNGQAHRDVLFIPASAHGTNFASATMAGYRNRKVDGLNVGIVLLQAGPDGLIDRADFDAKLAVYQDRLAGIMVTNPNTCGLFETEFRSIAEAVHAAGGLVYMDGANMNAVAGWCDLGAMGVDAVHNNLHKTWTIPHGGGGPGDAFVAVSEKLMPFLPGYQIEKHGAEFVPVKPPHSIGSFHRHFGNFAHKVRALTYLYRLGRQGVPRMTAMAVLSARYLYARLAPPYPILPKGTDATPRMHEFILTLEEEDFKSLESVGIARAAVIARVGKLFLDFGFHAPTVAWPETFGLMIEPTESYTKAELDRFADAVLAIKRLIRECPAALLQTPFFTPVERIDDVTANRNLTLHEDLHSLPVVHPNRLDPAEIQNLSIEQIYQRIIGLTQAQAQ